MNHAARLVSFGILALWAVGCTARQAPPSHYVVTLEPAFTTTELGEIIAAVGDWTAAVPELTVDVAIGVCPAGDDESAVCVRKAPPEAIQAACALADAEGCTRSSDTGADIYLAGDPPADNPYAVNMTRVIAAHELGHAMGLHHDTHNAFALMAPFVLFPTQRPTAADTAQWYSLRNLRI